MLYLNDINARLDIVSLGSTCTNVVFKLDGEEYLLKVRLSSTCTNVVFKSS